MSNKIPCGGFYLDDMLYVNDSGELSIKGGAPYQQLVTDGSGNTKWEDRLAYEGDNRLVVPFIGTAQLVKVADEVPSWASVDAPMKIWVSNGTSSTANPEEYIDLGNGSFAASEFVVFITTDNLEFNSIVFPEKGVYFTSIPDNYYVTGAASADSDTPEITWDGNISEIKKLDEKFIPVIPAEKLPVIPASVIEVNGSFISTIENVSQPSYAVKNLSYSDILSIFNSKNFLIKDTYTYYRPIYFEILTSGSLSVTILVNSINSSGNLVVTDLVCNNGQSRFYRNAYCTIVGTKKS